MSKATFTVNIAEEAAQEFGRYQMRLSPDIDEVTLRKAFNEIIDTVLAWQAEVGVAV